MREVAVRCVGVGLVVILLHVTTGCSSSPKQEAVDSTDDLCAEITERFTGDLNPRGLAPKSESLQPMLNKRLRMIHDLRAHVQALPVLEAPADQTAIEEWLSDLEMYAEAVEKIREMYEDYYPGAGYPIAMSYEVARASTEGLAKKSKALGMDDCAEAKQW